MVLKKKMMKNMVLVVEFQNEEDLEKDFLFEEEEEDAILEEVDDFDALADLSEIALDDDLKFDIEE